MAVQQQIFTTEDFDYTAAKEKQLVAMVNEDNGVVGTGILKYNSPNNLNLTVDGVTYTFNSNGQPVSKNAIEAGYNLKMGISQMPSIKKGTVGATTHAVTRSVNDDGDVTYEPSGVLDKTYEITIDNLNARDQFAIQALRGMLEKISNPDEIGKNEITHYCEAAYTWAGYMMTESSKARSVIKDADASDNTKPEEIGYLDTNVEKLLNNIVAAIERNDIKEVVNGSEIYSDRIAIPKLMDFLDAYVKDGNTTLGLKDLIKAIKDSGGSGSGEVDIKTIPNINIGNTGLGRDADHPIFMSGGGFPSRQVLGSVFTEAIIHDFLTFNEAGAVGYSTKEEVKKSILGYLNAYADLATLSTAIYNSISSTIDNRIKAWLEAAKDAEGRSLTVNTPT